MKKLILLITLITTTTATVYAENLLSALVQINDRWAYEPQAWSSVPTEACAYTETQLIQQHLLQVHSALISRDVRHLQPQQARSRAASLKHLYDYARRGLFPYNATHSGRRPIFIDGRGVHCAVGYLIKKSGRPELSKHISLNMNDAYLLDMKDDKLADWVASSGFTAEELAWIQPAYFQPVDYTPLKGGTNGPVFSIIEDNTGGIIAAGLFDTADGMPAGSIAQYYSGFAGFDWATIGATGIVGQVYDMEYYKGNLYVAGDFYMADTVGIGSGVAMWDGSQWTPIGEFYIGALPNYVNDLEVYRDTLYAGGLLRSKFTAPEAFFGLAKWDGTQWRGTAADMMGEVRALKVHNGKLIVAGHLQMNDTNVTNIFRLNGSTVEYFKEPMPLPVNDVEVLGGEIYVGTDFYNQSRLDSLGLAVYRNNKWARLMGPEAGYGNSTGGVKCLQPYNSTLLVGGDFNLTPLMGSYGRNMGYYHGGTVHPLGIIDSTVSTMHTIGDELYIGGHFTTAITTSGMEQLNHVGQLHLPNYIGIEEVRKTRISVFPNPASSTLTIQGIEEPVQQLEMIDVKGTRHPCTSQEGTDGIKLEISHLKAGVYMLKVKTNTGVYSHKVTVQ